MSQEKHLMVDIEALSNESDGIITNIGCVLFNIDTGFILELKTFSLNWSEQCELGRKVKKDTLAWWFKQNLEAQKEIVNSEHETSLVSFHVQFKDLLRGVTKCWAKSPGFDYGMISNLFEQMKVPNPVPFRKIADHRDMLYIAKKLKIKLPDSVEVAHSALGDTYKQTRELVHIMKELKKGYSNE